MKVQLVSPLTMFQVERRYLVFLFEESLGKILFQQARLEWGVVALHRFVPFLSFHQRPENQPAGPGLPFASLHSRAGKSRDRKCLSSTTRSDTKIDTVAKHARAGRHQGTRSRQKILLRRREPLKNRETTPALAAPAVCHKISKNLFHFCHRSSIITEHHHQRPTQLTLLHSH